MPEQATGVVLFVNGFVDSLSNVHERYLAQLLHQAHVATLLFNGFSKSDEQRAEGTAHSHYDTDFPAERLTIATNWLRQADTPAHGLRPGYFAFRNGAGEALAAAAGLGPQVGAIVCYDGRADIAEASLAIIQAPTLLIVGENGDSLLEANRRMLSVLECEKKLTLVPRAKELADEPSALQEVAWLAAEWFLVHLKPRGLLK